MSAHLLVDISGHGFGHLAQTAPVLAALRSRHPALRVTVRTRVPLGQVRQRLGADVGVVADTVDVGMRMASAVHVLERESHEAYAAFHHRWQDRVEADARALEGLAPDLVVSNIAYRSLAAAARAGIPALAMSSLHWAAVYGRYCAHLPGAGRILGQMQAAYGAARCSIALEPALTPWNLPHPVHVGPVGEAGRARPVALREALGAAPEERLVLVALGGIATSIDIASWPAVPDVAWIAPAAQLGSPRAGHAFDRLPMSFADLLASSDAVVTKPGYGTFVDAACSARPVLHLRRPDWPEEPALGHWLAERVPTRTVTWEDLAAGTIGAPLSELLAAPPAVPITPTGVDGAAASIEAALGLRASASGRAGPCQ